MLKAYFTYVTSGLSVEFINLSLGSPTSFSWAFGPSQGTSTDENPGKLYPTADTYEVTLTITLTVGETSTTDTITLPVSVALTGTPMPHSIVGGVLARFPWASDLTVVDTLIKKWQKFLHTLIDPHIPENLAYNERIWPPLVNELILNLVLYDLITDRLTNAGVLALGASGSSGNLKRVETGPSNAEWFDSSVSVYQLIKPGGLYDSLTNRICVLASRLNVIIEFCPKLAKRILAPTILPSIH
jgi:PKD repeat protein